MIQSSGNFRPESLRRVGSIIAMIYELWLSPPLPALDFCFENFYFEKGFSVNFQSNSFIANYTKLISVQ